MDKTDILQNLARSGRLAHQTHKRALTHSLLIKALGCGKIQGARDVNISLNSTNHQPASHLAAPRCDQFRQQQHSQQQEYQMKDFTSNSPSCVKSNASQHQTCCPKGYVQLSKGNVRQQDCIKTRFAPQCTVVDDDHHYTTNQSQQQYTVPTNWHMPTKANNGCQYIQSPYNQQCNRMKNVQRYIRVGDDCSRMIADGCHQPVRADGCCQPVRADRGYQTRREDGGYQDVRIGIQVMMPDEGYQPVRVEGGYQPVKAVVNYQPVRTDGSYQQPVRTNECDDLNCTTTDENHQCEIADNYQQTHKSDTQVQQTENNHWNPRETNDVSQYQETNDRMQSNGPQYKRTINAPQYTQSSSGPQYKRTINAPQYTQSSSGPQYRRNSSVGPQSKRNSNVSQLKEFSAGPQYTQSSAGPQYKLTSAGPQSKRNSVSQPKRIIASLQQRRSSAHPLYKTTNKGAHYRGPSGILQNIAVTNGSKHKVSCQEPKYKVCCNEPKPKVCCYEPKPKVCCYEPKPKVCCYEPKPKVSCQVPKSKVSCQEPKSKVCCYETKCKRNSTVSSRRESSYNKHYQESNGEKRKMCWQQEHPEDCPEEDEQPEDCAEEDQQDEQADDCIDEVAQQQDVCTMNATMRQMGQLMNNISNLCECYYDSCPKNSLSQSEERHLNTFHKCILPAVTKPASHKKKSMKLLTFKDCTPLSSSRSSCSGEGEQNCVRLTDLDPEGETEGNPEGDLEVEPEYDPADENSHYTGASDSFGGIYDCSALDNALKNTHHNCNFLQAYRRSGLVSSDEALLTSSLSSLNTNSSRLRSGLTKNTARNARSSSHRQKSDLVGDSLAKTSFVEGISVFPTDNISFQPKSVKTTRKSASNKESNKEQGIYITTKPGTYVVRNPCKESSIHLLHVNPGSYIQFNM